MAFHLQAKTTVQQAQAQHVRAHLLSIIRVTLGHWFLRAHAATLLFQPLLTALRVWVPLKHKSATFLHKQNGGKVQAIAPYHPNHLRHGGTRYA